MVKAILAKIGSKKRKAYIVPSTSVEYFGTYWDGGSRSTYTAIRLEDMAIETGPHLNPPQFGGPRETPVVPLLPGYVIVEHGISLGKPATPRIHVHPDNLQKFLTNG